MHSNGLTLVKTLGTDLLDFIFPGYCYTCNLSLPSPDKYLCSRCLEKLPVLPTPFCSFCKTFLNNLPIDHNCKTYLHSVYSLWTYAEGVETLIHKFKYEGKVGLGKRLGQFLAQQLSTQSFWTEIETIIPVPLHPSRKRERGYNQAEVLAQSIAGCTEVELVSDALRRCRNTKDQTRLSAVERKENVKDAFQVSERIDLTRMTIMLVDDVITTGATLNECAKTLKQNGAKEVYASTLAVAV